MNLIYQAKLTTDVTADKTHVAVCICQSEGRANRMQRFWTKVCLVFLLLLFVPMGSASDICVVVSAKSTIAALDEQQVRDIFLGKLLEYPEGSKIIPIEQMDGSAQKEQFHALVTKKSEHQLRAYWAKLVFSGKGIPPKEVPDANAVKKLLTESPNIVGYINKDQIDASVKVVFTP